MFSSTLYCDKSEHILYQSEHFTVFDTKVTQAGFDAKAINRNHIISTYKSAASTNFPSTISFKFAINGKDNEAVSGQDHQLTIEPDNGVYTFPVIIFGEKDLIEFRKPEIEKILPHDTEFKVRVDMREVLGQFQKKGYYTTYSGEKIPESAYNGVYIAGSASPLSWDFDNLPQNPDYKLKDDDGDGIYEGNFILNPYDPDAEKDKEWHLTNDIDDYPTFKSDQLLVDALYNMSLDETIMLIEGDSTFRTGAEWDGVWTRDISYSVLLSLGMLEPEISMKSLMKKVKRNRIIEDTGSGGAWPVSTDREVWGLAAWELYKVTGDTEWLEKAYTIIENSLQDDLENVYDERAGLFKGESSFLDWREQSYPGWMDNVDISQSINLGTNAVFFRTFEIMSEMVEELGKKEEVKYYAEFGRTLKEAINTYLWNKEKGYYDQYLYGRYYLVNSPRFEALGTSLSILFGIADKEKSVQIISEAPLTPFGVPTIYPQIPNIPPYHNNAIWPFVQSYWNWAAASVKNEKALAKGLGSLYRSAALFVTNKENFVAGSGDFKGTQINSDRQLWSVAGNLSMVYRVFLGTEFQPDKIIFNPVIPAAYSGKKIIENFKYRKAILNFEILGFGDSISEITLDGKPLYNPEISGNLIGEHDVVITMNNHFAKNGRINETENRFSLSAPRIALDGGTLVWEEVKGAVSYLVFRNGELIESTLATAFALGKDETGFYQVSAIDEMGIQSFLSEPIEYLSDEGIMTFEAELFAPRFSEFPLINYTGSGAVEISKAQNREILFPVNINETGTYLLSFRYSNGSGPWNTDNKCAIRSLYVNSAKKGSMVFAQRGLDVWSNWGTSNYIKVQLDSGNNEIKLIFEPTNENMNGGVNRALIDLLTIVKI